MSKRAGKSTAGPTVSTTRKKILDAAIHCVTKWGVAKTHLNDIAREAGVTRPTVYSYFPGRDELLAAALMQLAMEFGQRLLLHMKGFNAPGERFTQSVLFAIDELSKEPFSSVIREGGFSSYVGEDALPNPQGWRLVTMLMGQILEGTDCREACLEDMAEASARLVLSHLMVRSHRPRPGPERERFIRRSCQGLMQAFCGVAG